MTERTNWRLIRSGSLPGAMNMALDDALLHAVADGASLPVLRIYRWQPAALSLGYAQSAGTGIDLQACRAAGVDVVRRPTGGRAVLHAREVTYAVVAPLGAPFGSSITASYEAIAAVLLRALRQFNLPAELVPGRVRRDGDRAVCFAAPAQHELLIKGGKVAGCAQKRRKQAFLQHGSIPLDLDLELLQQLLPAVSGEDAAKRHGCIGWLNRYSPVPLSVEAVETVLIESFAAAFDIDYTDSVPTEAESGRAEQLCREWYGNPDWILAGPGPANAAGYAMTIE